MPIFLDVYGQQGSRDLTAEYCVNNWARDPVRCADYVPKDYDEKKSEYQAQELEKVKQETSSKLAQKSQRICPLGSHLGKDSFGNQVCLDSKTNQFVSYPNTDNRNIDDDNTIAGIAIVIFIIMVIAIIAAKSRKSSSSYDYQYTSPVYDNGVRRGWTEIEKETVRIRQGGKCNRCGRPPPRWEYHHLDGNRGNNNLSNCEGLCPNCHSVESYG